MDVTNKLKDDTMNTKEQKLFQGFLGSITINCKFGLFCSLNTIIFQCGGKILSRFFMF